MRYEVYGIYNADGVNYLQGIAKSYVAALKLVAQIDITRCKYFAILTKHGRHSWPYSIDSGTTANGVATRSTMLVVPSLKHGNPIQNEADGKRYWSKY